MAVLPRQTLLPAVPDPALDRFADLVRRVLDVPTALVSLVDQDHQAFPGATGLPEPYQSLRQTPLTHSFCQYVVARAEPLVVSDARLDPVLSTNRAVIDLSVVAYAGIPLVNQAGDVIGSLCAIDAVPRDWTTDELANLTDLAAASSSELQLREVSDLALHDAAHLDRLLATMPVGYITYDAEWRFRAINDTAARMMAQDPADLIGRVLWDLFPGTLDSGLEAAFRRVRATGVDETLEWGYPGDNEAWYEIRVRSDPPMLSVFYTDITARRESDSRAEMILSEMPVGYAGLDADFRITAINNVAAELVGLGVEDLVGTVLWDLFPELENSSFGQAYRRVALTGETETLEAYYPEPLNTWYDVRAVKARTGVSLFFLDVSERREAQAVLERAGEHDRTVAETLQQSLLTELPEVAGITMAARYLTVAGTDQVGGDWYDAVVQSDGSLAVSVGDVCGHGIEAAAAMSQLRSMLRAFLWDDPGTIASALGRLDRAARGHGETAMATLVSGRLEGLGETAAPRFVWSNAGHPPPLLLLADGTVERIEAQPELMLGVLADAPRTDHTRELPAGSTLVLYTDGLIERRSGSIQDGIERLAVALSRHCGDDLDELLDQTLADLHDGGQDDDIAVLAIRVATTTTLSLTPDYEAPGIARAFVMAAVLDRSEEVVDRVVLLTSEVVTNAVRHGAGEITVQVTTSPTSVLVTVHDQGDDLPVVAGPPDPWATGGRGLPIIEALASTWGTTSSQPPPGKAVWFRVEGEPTP